MSNTGALSLSPGRSFIRDFFNVFDSLIAFRLPPFSISHFIHTATEFSYDDDAPISAADQILLL